MSRGKWLAVAPIAAMAGGLAWILKVALILENEGTNTDEGVVGLAYVLGLVLILVGATSVGAFLAKRATISLFLAATLASAVLFFISFALLDALARGTLGDTGGAYMEDEWGILLTGVLWLLVGGLLIWLVRTSPAPARA